MGRKKKQPTTPELLAAYRELGVAAQKVKELQFGEPTQGTASANGALTQFLTREEVAKLLRIERPTLIVWARTGRGPRFYRIGTAVRYRREDVEAFIKGAAVRWVPQDSESHLDDAWLLSVGFTIDNHRCSIPFPQGTISVISINKSLDGIEVRNDPIEGVVDGALLIYRDTPLTRGDIRRLASALHIDLKGVQP